MEFPSPRIFEPEPSDPRNHRPLLSGKLFHIPHARHRSDTIRPFLPVLIHSQVVILSFLFSFHLLLVKSVFMDGLLSLGKLESEVSARGSEVA